MQVIPAQALSIKPITTHYVSLSGFDQLSEFCHSQRVITSEVQMSLALHRFKQICFSLATRNQAVLGASPPASILIQQICHKSFYKCLAGGYRSQWKCSYSGRARSCGDRAPVTGSFRCVDSLRSTDHLWGGLAGVQLLFVFAEAQWIQQ